MKVQKFETCPEESDTFITGVGLSTFGDIPHRIEINVVNINDNNVGCGFEGNCLGYGSLELAIDGKKILNPQDYHFQDGSGRVIAYNTFFPCSRQWFDFDISPAATKLGAATSSSTAEMRALAAPSIFDVLGTIRNTMVDKESCDEWMDKRRHNGDLFAQSGRWSTIVIQTRDISLHVEYKQESERCTAHDLDVWISAVNEETYNKEHWEGIIGETKNVNFKREGDFKEMKRSKALKYRKDQAYEVVSAFSTKCRACVNRGKDFRRRQQQAGMQQRLQQQAVAI